MTGREISYSAWRCPNGSLAISRNEDSRRSIFAYIVGSKGSWVVEPQGGWTNSLIDSEGFTSEQEALNVTLHILESVNARLRTAIL